jgi:hypothetical protein
MKWFIIVIAVTGMIGLGFAAKKKKTKKQEIVLATGSYAPIALLELFTSEGCSSCPPADRLLPELTNPDSNIISLAFHVDYWNRLGWEDPFSNSAFSERQRQYCLQLHSENIYTPQLVVNGEYELLGSDRREATLAIKKVLAEKASTEIHIDEVKKDGSKLIVNCSVEGAIKKMDLLAALVQKQASIDVKAGENNGSKLSHTNIVRSFVKQSAGGKTTFSLKIPDHLAEDNWQLVVYAQLKASGKITGAILYTPGKANNQ